MKNLFLAFLVFVSLGFFAFSPTAEFTATSSAQQIPMKRVLTQDPEPDVEVTVEEEEISLSITAPTKVKIGDLVVLSVGDSNAVNFDWFVLPSTDNFLVIDKGRRAVFSSGSPGTFTFAVAAARDNNVKLKYHTIQVIGEPQDDFTSKIIALCEKVDSPKKRDDLLLLSASFSSVASTIGETSTVDPAMFARITRESNEKQLKERYNLWADFGTELGKLLGQMAQKGELQTVQDHVKVWNDISQALRLAAEQME